MPNPIMCAKPTIIDGKAIADLMQQELKESIGRLSGRKPSLCVILVGDHPASKIYIERKRKACESVGIVSIKKELPAAITEEGLIEEIEKLNQDPAIDGILVQLPLPHHINPNHITTAIDPKKDVDGFHPLNVGKLLIGQQDGFFPCTPFGVKVMLERSGIEVSGKHVLVLGRSNIVGKPMAALLIQSMPGGNATVTIGHSNSQNIEEHCRMADIIIVAIGKPRFIKADMVKEGAVVIDVGINKIEDPSKPGGYRIVGDVDFDEVAPKCSYISPVPGGVGPMTIAMLLQNTYKSFLQRTGR